MQNNTFLFRLLTRPLRCVSHVTVTSLVNVPVVTENTELIEIHSSLRMRVMRICQHPTECRMCIVITYTKDLKKLLIDILISNLTCWIFFLEAHLTTVVYYYAQLCILYCNRVTAGIV